LCVHFVANKEQGGYPEGAGGGFMAMVLSWALRDLLKGILGKCIWDLRYLFIRLPLWSNSRSRSDGVLALQLMHFRNLWNS